MEAIVRKWDTYSLIWISDKEWELELAKSKYDEVITDYVITNEQKKLISFWADFIYNWEIIIGELNEQVLFNLEEEKRQEINRINAETRSKILASYSETDQTNLERSVSRITATALFEKRDFTADELFTLAEAKVADEFINTCIAEGKQRILELN